MLPTNKVDYRNALNIWVKMMNQGAIVDNKPKAILTAVGYGIYCFCDASAQKLLRKALKAKTFCLKNESDSRNKDRTVEATLFTIAQVRPTERVRHEVDLLLRLVLAARRTVRQ